MEIELNLSKHCIETEARRQYNRLLSKYFKADADKGALEVQIEMLQTALENFDFGYLRKTYAELSGHSDAAVALVTDDQSKLRISVNGEIIYPES